MNNALMKNEYSEAFDEKRKGLVEQSYYKYGPARMNFATGNVDAIGSLKKCLADEYNIGLSPSGKAVEFDSTIRRFESY